MKLSDIGLTDISNADPETMYAGLNSSWSEYPRFKNVARIFDDCVKRNPGKTAVTDGNGSLTYEELDKLSNRIARFILARQYEPEAVIAVYLSKSNRMIGALLGILKAGAAFLPLNVEYPYERVRQILQESKACLILTEKAFIKEINKLQWESPALEAFLCLDSMNVRGEEETRSEWMNKEFWEYIGHTAADDIEAGGWTDSFTGKNFSAEIMDEYGSNILEKLRPYLGRDKKVLEIGCASGLSMYKIAPLTGSYHGTDLSQSIIDRNRRFCDDNRLTNITLTCLEAEDIDRLEEGNFDIIIMNSVLQAFSGHNYLRRILEKMIGLLAPQGILFFGDVMDQDRKEALLADLQAYRKTNNSFATRTDLSGELFLSKGFFEDLRLEYEAIDKVEFSGKIHTIPCELTDYRYDALIKVDKNRRKAYGRSIGRNKQQYDDSDLQNYSDDPVECDFGTDRLAYIIFTSGSTGTPKGVLIEHAGLLRAVCGLNYVDIKPEDVWLQTCNIAFDAASFEIFGALLNGCTLNLIPMDTLLDVDRLREYLGLHQVSIMAMVAPIFHEHASSRPSVFATLKTLIIGGDVLSPKAVNAVRSACPSTGIVNVYGPTENAITSTWFRVDGSYSTIPIGKPASNTRVYILNGSGELQPVGMAGELCVSGEGMARGYLNDPLLTHQKFVEDPLLPGQRIYLTGDRARLNADGNIEFLGRKDDQVKIRGNRIELNEIEQQLREIPEVANVVLLPVTRSDQSKMICAYLILSGNIEVKEIRNRLALRLPYYMIPSSFVIMEKFPLNANNKVDRKALPRPEENGAGGGKEYTPPRNAAEQKVSEVWRNVLDNQMISIFDNFFEIGGDSLRLIKVFNRINELFPDVLQISDLFDSPTIEKQAIAIQRASGTKQEEASGYIVMKF
jgi:surfactin family lipopeptide synthetase B